MIIKITENNLHTLIKECVSRVLLEQIDDDDCELELDMTDYLNNVIDICNKNNIPWREFPLVKKFIDYPGYREYGYDLGDKLGRNKMAKYISDWANLYMRQHNKREIFKKNYGQQFIDPMYESVRFLNDSVSKCLEKYQFKKREAIDGSLEDIYKNAKQFIVKYEKMQQKNQQQA